GGGLYAMAEGDGGTGLTPGGGHFGFLPFVVSSTSFDSSEAGATVTLFGASLGLTDADVSFAFSHNVFDSAGTGGLAVVDTLPSGQILSLAGRGRIDADTGIMDIPEPTTLVIWSLLATLGLSVGWRRRRRAA
ncbi:MAG: hypothetical protein IID44_26975, partial [Planctomycetes bacterium]|nr:hypothetical protein [Planctomycetota bacterium]